MDCVCVKNLTNVPTEDFQNYLTACKQDFQTRQLYSASRDEKFTDEDLRKSMFRPIVDNTSFDLADSVISTSIKMINLTGSLYEGMMLLT